jgi:hypothetical protein
MVERLPVSPQRVTLPNSQLTTLSNGFSLAIPMAGFLSSNLRISYTPQPLLPHGVRGSGSFGSNPGKSPSAAPHAGNGHPHLPGCQEKNTDAPIVLNNYT